MSIIGNNVGNIVGSSAAAAAGNTFVGFSTLGGTANATANVVNPVGSQSGDLVIILANARNMRIQEPDSGVGDWTLEDEYQVDASGISRPRLNDEEVRIYAKFLGGSEPATWPMVFNAGHGTDGYRVMCVAFRGPTVGVVSFNAVGGANLTSASFTAEDGDFILPYHGCVFDSSAVSSVTEPALTTLVDKQYNATIDVGMAVAYELGMEAGATGTRVWTSGWTSYSFTGNLLIR